MTQDESRRTREAVLPDVDNSAVVHLHVECVTSARHMMYQASLVHRMLTAF